MKNFILLVILILFFSSCYYDNLDELHPEAGLISDCDPDTTAVTYSKDIAPLMLLNCGSDISGCHKEASANNKDVLLATYDGVSGVAITGQLLASVTHSDPGNVSFMPLNGGMLSDCKINKIKAWINQGLVQ